jgi:hypothetical protein
MSEKDEQAQNRAFLPPRVGRTFFGARKAIALSGGQAQREQARSRRQDRR